MKVPSASMLDRLFVVAAIVFQLTCAPYGVDAAWSQQVLDSQVSDCASKVPDPQCVFLCTELHLTTSEPCDDFLTSYGFKLNGYKSSSMHDIVNLLMKPIMSTDVSAQIFEIWRLIDDMPESKVHKYFNAIVLLTTRMDSWQEGETDTWRDTGSEPEPDTDPDHDMLTAYDIPKCEGGFEPGDLVSFVEGGPDFEAISRDYKGYANASSFSKKWLYRGISNVTKRYAQTKQTTRYTGDTHWTHTELVSGTNEMISAYSDKGVVAHDICDEAIEGGWFRGPVMIHRYLGLEKYKSLAAARAKMWMPYLKHYGDTIGQWYSVVLGKCVNRFIYAGEVDYWKAVTTEMVEAMWKHNSTHASKDFLAGMRNSFRTHDSVGRIKPKAMFCSKFAAAVWSSVIGNPTEQADAKVNIDDVNRQFPLRPGSCSPWAVTQWMVKRSSRPFWHSCIGDPFAGWDPC